MAAAGASALNQYWERNRDGLMGRTRHRPLVNGDITDPRWVPLVGVALVLVPVLVVLPFNRPLAFFLLLGAFIYVGIYTIWLKPRTLLNIVIGGAAGSAAVLSGSAAAGAWNDVGALVLAAILFSSGRRSTFGAWPFSTVTSTAGPTCPCCRPRRRPNALPGG
jgi:protoheme IX farnesyltransferase